MNRSACFIFWSVLSCHFLPVTRVWVKEYSAILCFLDFVLVLASLPPCPIRCHLALFTASHAFCLAFHVVASTKTPLFCLLCYDFVCVLLALVVSCGWLNSPRAWREHWRIFHLHYILCFAAPLKRQPTCVIPGYPKCGTTSLAIMLTKSLNCELNPLKESRFMLASHKFHRVTGFHLPTWLHRVYSPLTLSWESHIVDVDFSCIEFPPVYSTFHRLQYLRKYKIIVARRAEKELLPTTLNWYLLEMNQLKLADAKKSLHRWFQNMHMSRQELERAADASFHDSYLAHMTFAMFRNLHESNFARIEHCTTDCRRLKESPQLVMLELLSFLHQNLQTVVNVSSKKLVWSDEEVRGIEMRVKELETWFIDKAKYAQVSRQRHDGRG